MEEKKELFIKEVRPGIFLMDEAHEATGYLVVGRERACVIDTMNGYCDLGRAVRELTDKPVTVVNTHGHPDHIFGNVYFTQAFLHPAAGELARSFAEDPGFLAICREGETIVKIPLWVALIVLFASWFTVLVLVVVSLFFGCRYRFVGEADMQAANDIMDKAANAADKAKEEFKK